MGLPKRLYLFIPVLILLVFQFKPISSHLEYGIEDVFCNGPILHVVQMARLFNDSKTFVDMHLKASPSEIVKDFGEMMQGADDNPLRQDIKEFVHKNFEPENNEFDKWAPKDWVENPSYLNKINDKDLRQYGSDVNVIWTKLGRQIKDAVRESPDRYSLIWVPKPFIVPGGRFREYYYWDSYWIIDGLLISGMFDTARGMLENFVYLVNKFGHIPNGGRLYYVERSQPPLFVPMVKKYFDATCDIDFIKDNLETLDKEFEYWMKFHMRNFTFNNVDYTMAAYGDKSRGPRPESYYEDVKAAEYFATTAGKEAFYTEIKAAAESGWDFSSRWFYSPMGDRNNLTYTETTPIIPVDLNSFLHWNAVILRDFHKMLNSKKADYYDMKAQNLLEAINAVLWDDRSGVWFDFDINTLSKRHVYYASNLVPLYTMSYPQTNQGYYINKVISYLTNLDLLKYPFGVPTTLEDTGEQWDFPNVWPPLQHMMIFGLQQSDDPVAKELALNISNKWILTTYNNYIATNSIYEKYNVLYGSYGSGGEYEVQTGFGWTNGVIISLLDTYGSELSTEFDVIKHKKRFVRSVDDPNNNNDSNSSNDGIFIRSVTAALCVIGSFFVFRFSGYLSPHISNIYVKS
ncbi:trehalase-like isoform X2 [Onthophagus taurus]|uniref:trehalase-like isoform X2 n=1 Tax=Onthophagus taurus TaxID=166361 RepID=UPI0039BE01EA